MLSSIKTPIFTSTEFRILPRKIHTQEEIVDLEILQEQHGWKAAERIKKFNEQLIQNEIPHHHLSN